MKIYAVIDTNVLISGLLSKRTDTATVQILQNIAAGIIIPLYNSEILSEYIDVLSRTKFNFSKDRITFAISVIREVGLYTEQTKSGITLSDPDDLVFYEVALSERKNNDYLVTGNSRHFPKEPFIVTPAEMMKIISD